MKATMIKRLNVVISLWLLAIMVTLIIFGHELAMSGFYIAAIVVASLLLISNVSTIISGFILTGHKSVERETEYNKY